MKKIVSIVLTCSLIFLSACATSPANIIGTNVSPQMYANWDCEQIQSEILRLNSITTNLTAQQAKIYKNDLTMGWIGTLLLWPLYFFIKGDGTVAAELASAKGEMKALNQISTTKKCGS